MWKVSCSEGFSPQQRSRTIQVEYSGVPSPKTSASVLKNLNSLNLCGRWAEWQCGSVVHLPEKWICSDGWHRWHCTGLSLLLNHSFKLILWAQRSRCALCPQCSGPGSSNRHCRSLHANYPCRLAKKRQAKLENKEVFAHLLRQTLFFFFCGLFTRCHW